MKPEKITTVWLDLDDTLIDFTTNAEAALCAMYAAEEPLRRLFATADEWIGIYERHNKALWTLYARAAVTREHLRMERFRLPLTEAGCSDAEARSLSARYDTFYLDLLARGKALMPGAIELLRWLSRRPVKIAILSNGFRDVQFRKIHTAGLDPYIHLVVLSDDIGINKPDQRIYTYAMQQAGDTSPAHHIMIGDNPSTDIAGAISAGWHAIWYLPERARANYTPAQSPCGAILAHSLADIPSLLGPLIDVNA